MDKSKIKDAEMHLAKEKFSHDEFIEGDLIINDDMKRMAFATQPWRMTFIFVGLCTKGHARYTVDTQEHSVDVNDVIIITDRHVVENSFASPDLEGLCMMISVEFFADMIKNVSEMSSLLLFAKNHPVAKLTEHEAEMFKNYFYLLKAKVADTQNYFRRDVVKTLMLAMTYDLGNVIYHGRQAGDRRNTRGDAIFTSFIRLVEDNFKSERRVSWYASQLCITPKYLSETVKHVSKRTPNEWIDDYVILEARVLLKNSSKNIKEIASELNFPNQSFLGKFFKEHVGVSPSVYRRS